MTSSAPSDRCPSADQHKVPAGRGRDDGELEVVSRSGGAYCLAKKQNPMTPDPCDPPADLIVNRATVGSGDDPGDGESESGHVARHRCFMRWFKWVPNLKSFTFSHSHRRRTD